VTDLCPSCREPLDYPSGDGCAAMTKHQPHQCASPEAIVRAALERAAEIMHHHLYDVIARDVAVFRICDLAADPAEVAAIIMAAGETND